MKATITTAKAPAPAPVFTLVSTSGAPVAISNPQPGDRLAVLPSKERTRRSQQPAAVVAMPAPIIGWARSATTMSIYLPGSTSATFRTALEEPGAVEHFFSTPAPATMQEVLLDEHPVGSLVYYPAVEQLALGLAATA